MEVKTVAAESTAGATRPRLSHAKVCERIHVHVHISVEEHCVPTAAAVEVEEGLEGARRTEELRERSLWVPMECVGEGLATTWAVVRAHSSFQALLAVHVIDFPFLFVREDLVRLCHFLEPLFRASSLVLVGMVLQRQLAVRFLYLVIARSLRQSQYFVVIFPHL